MENLDIYDLTDQQPWASSPTSQTDIKRLRQGKVGAQVETCFHTTTYLDEKKQTIQIVLVRLDWMHIAI